MTRLQRRQMVASHRVCPLPAKVAQMLPLREVLTMGWNTDIVMTIWEGSAFYMNPACRYANYGHHSVCEFWVQSVNCPRIRFINFLTKRGDLEDQFTGLVFASGFLHLVKSFRLIGWKRAKNLSLNGNLLALVHRDGWKQKFLCIIYVAPLV